MKKRNNRQSVKTEKILKKLFLDELNKKNLEKITVSELCRLADIDRSTFYLHYKDVYDLLERVENDFYNLALSQAELIKVNENGDTNVMNSLLKFIYDNKYFLKLFIDEPFALPFWSKINLLINDLFKFKVLEEYIIPSDMTEKQLDDIIRFLTYGYYSVYSKWLQEDCQESMAYISNYSSSVSSGCLDSMLIKK